MFKQPCLVLALLAVVSPSQAEDFSKQWPGFRGPEFTGVAPHGNPPTTWSEDENVRWKVELPGQGSGSPIVWGDRIYLQTAIKTDRTADGIDETATTREHSRFRLVVNDHDSLLAQAEGENPRGDRPPEGERRRRGGFGGRGGGFGRAEAPTNYYQFVVMCLDRKTGDVIWQQTATEAIPHEGHHGTASFASPTPVTDGKNIFVSFGSRGIYSYTMDGDLRWQRDFGKQYTRHSFGEGASPALYKDTLIVNWDHEGQSFITALDANTGETKWKVDRDEETTWLTPLIVEHDGRVQIVVNGMNRARGYDLENGEVIWECGGQAMGPVPTAVTHEGLVFCMTGHRGAALYAIPLSAKGDITDSDEIAWSLDRDTPYVPSPLLYGNQLYFTKSNNAILSCYNAETGEAIYRGKRIPELDMVYASPVAAAGRIYFAGRNGATTVIKHGSEFEVLGTNMLDEPIDATPAIVDDELIIRTSGHLYSIAE